MLTTVVRLSAIDNRRWFRHIKSNRGGNECAERNRSTENSTNGMLGIALDFEMKIRKFSGMLCSSIRNGKIK